MNALYCEASDLLNLSESKQYTLFATPLLEKLLSDTRLIKGAASLWQLLYSFAKCNSALEVTIKYQTIAKKMGKSTKTISRYIKSLNEHGYLLNRKNFREDGGQSCYTFALRIAKDILKDVQKAPDRKKHTTDNEDKTNFYKKDSSNVTETIQTQEKPHLNNQNIPYINCATINHDVPQEINALPSNDSTQMTFTSELDKTVRGGVDITVLPYINNQEVLLNNNTAVVIDQNLKEMKAPQPDEINPISNEIKTIEAELSELILQENCLIQQFITANSQTKRELYQKQRNFAEKINKLKQRKDIILANHKQQQQSLAQNEIFIQTLYQTETSRALSKNQLNYLKNALVTLKIPSETQDSLIQEIIFAIRFDSLVHAKDSHKQLGVGHALNIAIKLIREGRWETPARFLTEKCNTPIAK